MSCLGSTRSSIGAVPITRHYGKLHAAHCTVRNELRSKLPCYSARRRAPQRGAVRVLAFGLPGQDQQGIGLTKSQELLAGRIAMQGFAWSILCEHLTGNGPLNIIGIETGVPFWEVDTIVLVFVALNTGLALLPARGTFVDQSTVSGSKTQGSRSGYSASSWEADVFKTYLEIVGKKVGLTKERELFIGRCAQIGLSASVITEAQTGAGLLENLDVDTGLSLEQADPHVLVFCLILVLLGLFEGTGRFVAED